jgi:hypothetical protein
VILCQFLERDLQGDRIGVEATDAVDSGCGRERNGVEAVERAEPGEVEDRPEVDEERVVTLPGKDRRERQGVTPADSRRGRG